jgi:hypothetical protein
MIALPFLTNRVLTEKRKVKMILMVLTTWLLASAAQASLPRSTVVPNLQSTYPFICDVGIENMYVKQSIWLHPTALGVDIMVLPEQETCHRIFSALPGAREKAARGPFPLAAEIYSEESVAPRAAELGGAVFFLAGDGATSTGWFSWWRSMNAEAAASA